MPIFRCSQAALIAFACVLVVSSRASLIREVTSSKFESHRISNLPGAPSVGFGQYSGYVTVDDAAGRALFYWLFEADVKNPDSAPLTLWLNGGPGCSSVGGGALSELGPFYPSKDGKTLIQNKYSWNKVSNLLFLESPAGVGFSYSNRSSDYTTGDAKTAADSVEFLVRFFEMYPVYAKRPFYIAGESYAGHYVPQLAAGLLEKNKELGDKAINFKGIAIGNAWTDSAIDNYGAIFYWWTHALISDSTYEGILNTCNFSASGPFQNKLPTPLKNNWQTLYKTSKQGTPGCIDYVVAADKEMGNINIYEIYVDVCLPSAVHAETRHFAEQLNRHGPGSVGARPFLSATSYDPCIDDEVETYLNQKDVQKALHVDAPGIPYRWTDCSYSVDYSYRDLLSSILPVYRNVLLKSGLEILIFSGDVDAIVPVTGTRAWINTLDLKIKEDWRPYLVNNQVGGYVTVYDGLTLATVRGAGHMVPYTQPERGLYLIKSFIENTRL